MNGVHDMGGMHGMGRVPYEKNEPVFHEPWEARVFAMDHALNAWRKWSIDEWRSHIESIALADYLRMSYYEKWLTAMETRVEQYGIGSGSAKMIPALTVEAARIHTRNVPSANDPSIAPKFEVGQRVQARNINPTGHTRLPRYARGKTGVITRDHGVYVFPDSSAQRLGDKRQHVYSVRFTARELWGEAASPQDFVHVDMWDDYLEHA